MGDALCMWAPRVACMCMYVYVYVYLRQDEEVEPSRDAHLARVKQRSRLLATVSLPSAVSESHSLALFEVVDSDSATAARVHTLRTSCMLCGSRGAPCCAGRDRSRT